MSVSGGSAVFSVLVELVLAELASVLVELVSAEHKGALASMKSHGSASVVSFAVQSSPSQHVMQTPVIEDRSTACD